MSIFKEIEELLAADVISKETADRIKNYYSKKDDVPNYTRLFVVFGILGAILVGLGIILIISHNWDQLSRFVKTIFAFTPLVIGQIMGVYTLLKKASSTAWREGVAAFIFFAVGASIALISQIYNLPEDLSAFLLMWMLLCLPLVYVMKSSITSLLYISGITFYAAQAGYWSNPVTESHLYWLLLVAVLPHYYLLYKKTPKSNFMSFHNWMIPISMSITLGVIANNSEMLLPIAYCSLFGLFYIIGKLPVFNSSRMLNNGYKVVGSLGNALLLLILSFSAFWEELRSENLKFIDSVVSQEFFATSLIVLIACILLYKLWKDKAFNKIDPIGAVFIVFILIFIIGTVSPIAVLLVNLLLFIVGILTIREGAKRNHLGYLNYGLLIISALVICRFFDTDLSFVIRGILFIGVGVGFFATNYWMLQKRHTNEK